MATTPRRLVIVESPAKANKIASYLGAGYVVESSRGHVRDLPNNASEVPAKYKGEPWARTGVNVEDDFTPLYVVNPDKKATIKKLKDDLASSDELYLATDEDREGEAIAWHLLSELKPKVPVKRMVFHEITPGAIQEAVANPRELDLDLVDAQETRRILDRLYGYEVSPVLWKKVMPRLSAGRVQSVATRLVVDRERERIVFVSASYWDLEAICAVDQPDSGPSQFAARLVQVEGHRIARGADFDANARLVNDAWVIDESSAATLAEALASAAFSVASVESKPYTRRPAAPFRTTTLQQEAGRKLGFSTDRTMRVAQELYESGFITYMRTDSVALSAEAVNAARAQARALFGDDFVPSQPRVYASKVKNAQEAHEAIRPAGGNFVTPAHTGLSGDQLRLYELIWQRTVASQMADAKGQSVSVRLAAKLAKPVNISVTTHPVGQVTFAASGRTVSFAGFMKAYVESFADADDSEGVRLPKLEPHQGLGLVKVNVDEHATKAPARYTEPSLIAKLEELEIGRPSTYASIIRTITARDYVFKKGSALVPTWLAFAVTRLLEEHFPQLVDYDFTASLEDRLDEVANGNLARLEVLQHFYFGSRSAQQAGLREMVSGLGDIDARALSTFPLADDASVVVRVGRYGTYVEDADGRRANVADDMAPDELTLPVARELLARPAGMERELGDDPVNHVPLVVRNGRFGPYVTEILPDDDDRPASKRPKPRTASLFKSMDPATVTLDDALALLSLPRQVGIDSDGVVITAQNGPYGPYLKKGKDTRQLDSEAQIFTISLEQAQALYAQPKSSRRRAASTPLAELGTDPDTGKPVVIKDGRFGPYVTDGETNFTVPKTRRVADITLEDACQMLADKRAKGPAPKRTRKSATKATAKKTAGTPHKSTAGKTKSAAS